MIAHKPQLLPKAAMPPSSPKKSVVVAESAGKPAVTEGAAAPAPPAAPTAAPTVTGELAGKAKGGMEKGGAEEGENKKTR